MNIIALVLLLTLTDVSTARGFLMKAGKSPVSTTSINFVKRIRPSLVMSHDPRLSHDHHYLVLSHDHHHYLVLSHDHHHYLALSHDHHHYLVLSHDHYYLVLSHDHHYLTIT